MQCACVHWAIDLHQPIDNHSLCLHGWWRSTHHETPAWANDCTGITRVSGSILDEQNRSLLYWLIETTGKSTIHHFKYQQGDPHPANNLVIHLFAVCSKTKEAAILAVVFHQLLTRVKRKLIKSCRLYLKVVCIRPNNWPQLETLFTYQASPMELEALMPRGCIFSSLLFF